MDTLCCSLYRFDVGETFFSLENFLFFVSCFESLNEWYGYLPFFFHSLAAGTLPFAAKSFL